MTLKTGTPIDSPRKGRRAVEPGSRRARRSPARTGLMLLGVLTVVATMLRVARRRGR